MDVKKIIGWALPLIKVIWAAVSPALKEAIRSAVTEWEAKAAETPSQADDFLVGVVKWSLSVLDA